MNREQLQELVMKWALSQAGTEEIMEAINEHAQNHHEAGIAEGLNKAIRALSDEDFPHLGIGGDYFNEVRNRFWEAVASREVSLLEVLCQALCYDCQHGHQVTEKLPGEYWWHEQGALSTHCKANKIREAFWKVRPQHGEQENT